MIILSGDDVSALLPMTDAIEVVDRAMRAVSRGQAEMPLRHAVPVGDGNAMGVMSGALMDPRCYGVKLVSLFPGNPARGLSSHRGAVVLFESDTGGAVAMMEGGLITALRTAAASAVATRALARADATRLTLIGTGEQAVYHLDAICAVRPICALHVVGRSADKARAFAEMAARKHPQLDLSHGTDAQAGVANADIICTVTASATPVLHGDWVPEGAHVNIVGASIPSKREVDDRMVTRAALWVDYLPSALAQAGELTEMIAAGTYTPDELQGEIGALLSGDIPGRTGPEQITAYRSLGVIAQDLAVATHVTERAQATGTGTNVAF